MESRIFALCLLASLSFGYKAVSNNYEDEETRGEEAFQLNDEEGLQLSDEEGLQLDENAKDPFLLDTFQSIADVEKKAAEFAKKTIDFGKKALDVGKKVFEVGKKAYEFAQTLGEKAHKALNAIGITDEVLKAMPQKIIQQGSKAIEAFAREKGIIN